MKANEFLRTALTTLNERGQDRDEGGERSMARIVKLFNALYDAEMSEEQGFMFMVLLKAVRASTGSYNEDNYIDLAGYSALLGEAAKNRYDFLLDTTRDVPF